MKTIIKEESKEEFHGNELELSKRTIEELDYKNGKNGKFDFLEEDASDFPDSKQKKEIEFHRSSIPETYSTKTEPIYEYSESSHDRKKTFPCKICSLAFVKEGNLDNHYASVHGIEKSVESEFKCSFCDKIFVKKHRLKSHISTVHAENKQWKCDICLKEFTQKGSLNLHVKTIHEKIKPFKCDLETCEATFVKLSVMKKHFQLVHEKQKSFKCEICDLVFKHEGNLKRHTVSGHDENKPKTQCVTCGKTFKHKG